MRLFSPNYRDSNKQQDRNLAGFTGDLLVLNGDVPLLRQQTLKQLMELHQQHKNSATLLTANLPNPQGYGRVFTDSQNLVKEIVEDRDCTAAPVSWICVGLRNRVSS